MVPSVDLRQKLHIRWGLLAPTLALRPTDNAPLWALRQGFFTTCHRRPKPTTPAPPAPMPAKPLQTSPGGTRPPTQARHPRTPPSSPEARKTHYPKKLPQTLPPITFSVLPSPGDCAPGAHPLSFLKSVCAVDLLVKKPDARCVSASPIRLRSCVPHRRSTALLGAQTCLRWGHL